MNSLKTEMTNVKEEAARFYRLIVEPFILHPEDLRVRSDESNQSVTLTVDCHADDQGRIIGTQGRMIAAIKHLMDAFLLRFGKRAHLIQLEPWTGEKSGSLKQFVPDPNWKPGRLIHTISDICDGVYFGNSTISYKSTSPTSTRVTVIVDDGEQPDKILDNALSIVCDAIGKSQGQIVLVEVER